jgi:hypothetical protein
VSVKNKLGQSSTWRPGSGSRPATPGGFEYNEARKKLIARLGVQRGSSVVVLFDLHGAPDLPRYLFEHLRDAHRRSHEKLTLVLYANGHTAPDLDQATAVSSILRDHVRELEVLVAHRALGLGTLLGFAADSVFLHPLSRVGGLKAAQSMASYDHYRTLSDDPTLLVQEMGAGSLAQASLERARLRAAILAIVAGRVQPRLEATQSSLDTLLDDATCPLATQLDRRRARALPWQIEHLDPDSEATLWELHCTYEGPLGLTQEPGAASKSKLADTPVDAVLESSESLHVRSGGQWSLLRGEDLH